MKVWTASSFTPTATFFSRGALSHAKQCSSSGCTISVPENLTNKKNTHHHHHRINININAVRSTAAASHVVSQSHNNKYSMRSPPPGQIGTRWAEYQGVHDWAGLLDPLDETLRKEILRYGYFVEAAYRSFEFDPSSPTYGSSLFPHKHLLNQSGFPDTGYEPTKNLRATSSIKLPFPRWTEKAGASWMNVQSSWIGYVAVCQDKKEIARLGRRDVVIAFRGTATCLEWMENLRATLTPLTMEMEPDDEDHHHHHFKSNKYSTPPMVESGFLSLYTSRTPTCPSLQHTLRTEIARILDTYKDEPLSFTFTGHSLGAALATLAAYDINKAHLQGQGQGRRPLFTTVVSFGGPRVGNQSFRSLVEKQAGVKILRIVNPDDVITKMPGFVMEQQHQHQHEDEHEDEFLLSDDEKEKPCGCGSGPCGCGMTTTTTTSGGGGGGGVRGGWSWEWPTTWFHKRVEDTKWVYAELGSELRVRNHGYNHHHHNNNCGSNGIPPSSSIINLVGVGVGPYNLDFAKCHDLKTYLNLVGNSVGSSSSLINYPAN